jgi:hypothetical protein
MNGRCTLTIRSQEVDFHFSINCVMEFADSRGVGLHEIDKYVSDNPHTSMRGIFFYGAKLAANMKGSKLNFTELEFGEMMAKFSESDYKTLVDAYKSSKPEPEKKRKAGTMKPQAENRLHSIN